MAMQFDEHYADRHYDPALPEFAHFPETIQQWEQNSALALARLKGKIDVAYAETEQTRFDLFVPEGKPSPLLLHIHGGLWMMCDKRETPLHAPRFIEQGIAFAGLNYTLAPKATLQQIVGEVRDAIAYIYRNAADLGVNPEAIYLSGHSAGGHLACMAAVTDWQGQYGLAENPLKGVVSLSGIHDLEPLLHARFLQPLIALGPDNVATLSPARYAAPPGVRLITAIGALENAEYRRQTALLNQAWSEILIETIACSDCHHGTVVDQLSLSGSALYASIIAMIHNR